MGASVLVVIVVTGLLLLSTGLASIREKDGDPTLTLASQSLWKVIGKGDSYVSLPYGSIAALLTAVVLCRVPRILSAPRIVPPDQLDVPSSVTTPEPPSFPLVNFNVVVVSLLKFATVKRPPRITFLVTSNAPWMSTVSLEK